MTRTENLTAHIKGLKCDNPACDHSEPDILFDEYAERVERPCPKCGEPLLTKADYDAVCQLVQLTHLLGGDINGEMPEGDIAQLSMSLDGSGVIQQMHLDLPDTTTD